MKTVAAAVFVWLLIGLVGTLVLYEDVRGHWMDIALGPGILLRMLFE